MRRVGVVAVAAAAVVGIGPGCAAFDASDSASAPADGGGDAQAASAYARAVLADQPLLYWRLGETGGAVVDSSGNGLAGKHAGPGVLSRGSLLAADPDPASEISQGASIDGPTDARLAFTGTAAFTLECWVKLDATIGGRHVVLSRSVGGPTASGWELSLDTGGTAADQIRAYVSRYEGGDGVMHATSPAKPLAIGRAHHVVATYGAERLTVYLDGEADESTQTDVPLTDRGYAFRVGRREDDAAKLRAVVDEVAVYPYALSPTRIAEHLRVGMSP